MNDNLCLPTSECDMMAYKWLYGPVKSLFQHYRTIEGPKARE